LDRGNLEEVAREKRYKALAEMVRKNKGNLVITAHTLDDQVETILMNLLRGSGTDGLAGMSPVRTMAGGVRIGRPLLSITKQDVLQYLDRSGIAYRRDRSNQNEGFLRNWFRKWIIPKLEQRSPGFKKRMAQLADVVREEQLFWEDFMGQLKEQILENYRGGSLLDFKKLLSYPPAVQRRFLRHILGGDLMSFEAIENLRNWMGAPPTSGRLWQLRKGWIAERLSKSQGSPSTSLFWLRKSRIVAIPKKRRR
jgi:tRNA(Ile)-lysidine synthase